MSPSRWTCSSVPFSPWGPRTETLRRRSPVRARESFNWAAPHRAASTDRWRRRVGRHLSRRAVPLGSLASLTFRLALIGARYCPVEAWVMLCPVLRLERAFADIPRTQKTVHQEPLHRDSDLLQFSNRSA